MLYTLSMSAPMCDISSYRLPRPMPCIPLFHNHFSALDIRIMQGVEWSTNNRSYMYPTCMMHHVSRLE